MRYFRIIGLTFALAVSACATNPVTGDRDFALMSESDEIKQGRNYHQQIIDSYGLYDDPELQRYVDRIGQELAAKSHRSHLKFTFTVLDSPDINAFALPGGYIYITRGILAYLDSEAELAGVLGHEIGHVTARHSVRQQAGQFASDLLGILVSATTGDQNLGTLSQQLGTGLVRGYGREHELEADRLGAEYLHSNSYDPESMLEVIGVLKDQEVYERARAQRENREPNIYHGVFATHPRNDKRLKTVVRAARKLSSDNYRENNRTEYHRMIDGLVWGPSVKQGVVNKNRFSHPELAFALDLPEGWQIRNTPAFLEARDNESGALVQISLAKIHKNESPAALLKRMTRNKELKIEQQSEAVSAITRAKHAGGEWQPARLSAIGLEQDQALILSGTASEKSFEATDRILLEIVHSFERLSQAQIDAIQVPRLRISPRGNESFDSLAQKSALEREAVEKLRLLNRAFPDGDIKSLQSIKTIVIDD